MAFLNKRAAPPGRPATDGGHGPIGDAPATMMQIELCNHVRVKMKNSNNQDAPQACGGSSPLGMRRGKGHKVAHSFYKNE